MSTVVVGNGIVGLTCALRLAQRGERVTIVGDPARTGSASLAAAAMLAAFGELDTGVLASAAGRAKFALAHAATARWRAFSEELGVPIQTGTWVLAGGDLGDGLRFEAIVAALSEYGEPHAIVPPSQAPGYAPLVPSRRCVRIDGEGWVDPRAVVAALERALVAAGVSRVDGIVARVPGPDAVELAGGSRVTGTRVLLANGARLTALLAASPLRLDVLPVHYGVGTTIELAPTVPHVACLRGRGVYLVPHADRVTVGATNVVGPEPVDDPTAATRIRTAAMEQLDHHLEDATLLRTNVGWRPTTADGYPLVGATSIPNVAIASGTRRDGFHLAPVIADHLAAILLGEAGDPRFEMFQPERAELPSATR